MATIAIYSLKGGVGKTTLAVNMAWTAAVTSQRRTLLWDLDPQGASTFLLGGDRRMSESAHAVLERDIAPERLIRATDVPGLDLLPADTSLRDADRFLFNLGKKRRLGKILDGLGAYDRVVLDCPPGLTETAEQVMRAATLVIAPVIPSPLSMRALHDVVRHFERERGARPPILPVFSMVDMRRALHRAALEEHPDWPAIPMASAIEQMAVRRQAVCQFAPNSPAAEAIQQLWRGIERKIAAMRVHAEA